MPDTPSTTINLLEATTRADIAHHIIDGFSTRLPHPGRFWRQIDDALADVAVLAAEMTRLSARRRPVRLDRANLAAAGRATIAAYLDGESDPLSYLRDELHAQGFGPGGGTHDQSPPDAPSRPPDAPLRHAAHGRHQLR